MQPQPVRLRRVKSMTYETYLRLLSLGHQEYIREGQHAYNVLNIVRPDLASVVVGTEIDPFHRNDNLPEFLKWVEASWGTP